VASLTHRGKTEFAWIISGLVTSCLSLGWYLEYDKGYGEWCWGGCCFWIILAMLASPLTEEQEALVLEHEEKKIRKHSSTEKCSCCGVIIKSKSIGGRVAKGTAGTVGGGYGGMLVGTMLAPGIGTLIGGAIGAGIGGSSGASQSSNICNNCCYGCKRRKAQCICRYYPNDDNNMSDEG